jgi:hypothetical protein
MMAKLPAPAFRISKDAEKKILSYLQGVMTAHRASCEIHTKMEAIDKAYARYVETGSEDDGKTECNVFGQDNIIAPIVVSQVDSLVGYLSEIFLSGYPLFPVVSTPKKRKWAEQLETLIDDHAILGGYARQLLLFLRDGVKYNVAAIEADWQPIEQFSVIGDYTAETARSIDRDSKYLTNIKRLDPYNLIWDKTISPGDVAKEGDHAGYIDVLSRLKLKRLLNRYTKTREVYNAQEALASTMGRTSSSPVSNEYHIHPTVSNYVTPRRPDDRVDWERYITGKRQTSAGIAGVDNFEVITLYARILPGDFGIAGPQQNTPQIWKFVVVNGAVVIHAKRIISAYDYLPILMGQPIEDGLGYQTQSVAEGSIPIQEGATSLFNIRFAAARRAVSDRALYDAGQISPSDINSPVASAKIPVKCNPMLQQSIESAYKQIPFDMKGTETTIQDAAVLVDFSKQLSGLNNAQQGQFQKGNKSVVEYTDVMGASDSRLRLPALTLEHQVFIPLKAIITLNIFQYGSDTVVVSQKTGEVLDVKLDELRKHTMSFRIADGYSPKSKLASTDMIVQGLNVIMNSPQLQQAYGSSLPSLFAHMMQLGGVRGLEEYAPENQMQGEGGPPGLIDQGLQGQPPLAPASAADAAPPAQQPII